MICKIQNYKDAWGFDFVIPNNDGEDSENWEEPIDENSDAYLAVKEFSKLLKNESQKISEKWEKNLLIKFPKFFYFFYFFEYLSF